MRTGYRSEYDVALFKGLLAKKKTFIPVLELEKGFSIDNKPLKNFDFLLASGGLFALDVKGKQFSFLNKKSGKYFNRYDTYVQEDEPKQLLEWADSFKKEVGVKLTPLFVFMFKIMEEKDAEEFVDILEIDGVLYGVLACEPEVYEANKKQKLRSEKFGVITVSRSLIPKICKPLSEFVPNLDFQL